MYSEKKRIEIVGRLLVLVKDRPKKGKKRSSSVKSSALVGPFFIISYSFIASITSPFFFLFFFFFFLHI
jgi:hypothetical protein